MKKLFSVILCMALMLSAFAVPALADDPFCQKVVFQKVSDNSSTVDGFDISGNTITGKMLKDKNEFRIKFDSIDVTPYVDNGYIGFCLEMSKVPTWLRVYPYSEYTDSDGAHHSLRPKNPYTVSPTGMEAGKPFWIYLPLKDLITMTGSCKSGHTNNCTAAYDLSSIGALIIQPQIEANDTDSNNSNYKANPITVDVKDLGLYVYKTEINGVSKDGYWMPITNGLVTDGTDLSNEFGYTSAISKTEIKATDYLSLYTMNDGYITFKHNTENTNGLAFYLGTKGLKLPVSETYLDNTVNRWDYSDYTLRLKIKSATEPENLYIGAAQGYDKKKVTGNNNGNIRQASSDLYEGTWDAEKWHTIDISLSTFMKGTIAKAESNQNSELGSITLFFLNETNTMSDICVSDIAIYGPTRGLTVTNLQITKDSEETAEYSAEDTLTLTAKASNTTSIARSFSTIGAFYNDNQLADVKIFNIEVPANTTDVSVTKPVTVPKESTTKFKAFAFSNLKDITPLCESTSADAQIAQ